MQFGAEPLTFVAKIASVLMAPMMKGMVKVCAKDLDDLAASCESRAGIAVPGGSTTTRSS